MHRFQHFSVHIQCMPCWALWVVTSVKSQDQGGGWTAVRALSLLRHNENFNVHAILLGLRMKSGVADNTLQRK